jgi:transposase
MYAMSMHYRLRYIRPFLRLRDDARVYLQSPDRSYSLVDVLKRVYSTYKKQWILYLYSQGYRPPTIKKMLDKENLKCSRVGVYKFLKLYSTTRSNSRRVGSGRPSKITAEIKQLVEQQMRTNDETNGVSTTPNANRERIHNFAPHYTEVLNCARMDVLWQRVLPNNSRNQAASRTTNENQRRDDGVSTTPNANRERIHNFAPHYTEVLNCARMDVLWQRVLPVDSRGQQAEATPMGTTSWPVIWGCHMDWWEHDPVGEPP